MTWSVRTKKAPCLLNNCGDITPEGQMLKEEDGHGGTSGVPCGKLPLETSEVWNKEDSQSSATTRKFSPRPPKPACALREGLSLCQRPQLSGSTSRGLKGTCCIQRSPQRVPTPPSSGGICSEGGSQAQTQQPDPLHPEAAPLLGLP